MVFLLLSRKYYFTSLSILCIIGSYIMVFLLQNLCVIGTYITALLLQNLCVIGTYITALLLPTRT